MRKNITIQTKIKITDFDVWFFGFWLLFFMPSFIERIYPPLKTMLTLLQLAIFGLIVLKYYVKPIKISQFLLFFLMFLAWCTVCTLYNRAGFMTYIKNTLIPIAELIFVTNILMLSKKETAFKMLYYVCCFYVVANFLSLVLFPGGMFYSDLGSSIARAQWIFGSKNNIPLYMILFVCVIIAYNEGKNHKWTNGILTCMGIYSIFCSGEKGMGFMEGSSTGIIAVVACCGIYIVMQYWSKVEQMLTLKNVLLVMGVGNLLLLTGTSMGVVSSVVTNVFQKSATFSGRTNIWKAAIEQISKSPIMGNNASLLEAPVYILGQLTSTSYTYNVILQYVLKYGIVSVILLVCSLLSIPKHANSRQIKIFIIGFVGVMVMGTMNEIGFMNLIFFPVFINCFANRQKAMETMV